MPSSGELVQGMGVKKTTRTALYGQKNMGTRGHWVASTRAALLRHFRFFSSTSLFGSHYWWSFFGLVWSFASVPTNRGSSSIHPRYSNLVIILIFCCHEFDFHAHLILADFHQRRNFFFAAAREVRDPFLALEVPVHLRESLPPW